MKHPRPRLAGAVALALSLSVASPVIVAAQEIPTTEAPATDGEGGGVGGAGGAGETLGGGLHSGDDETKGGLPKGPKSIMEQLQDLWLQGLLPPGVLDPKPTPNGPCGEPECFGFGGQYTEAELFELCAHMRATGGPADDAETVFFEVWCADLLG